jgi:hypothetical protein
VRSSFVGERRRFIRSPVSKVVVRNARAPEPGAPPTESGMQLKKTIFCRSFGDRRSGIGRRGAAGWSRAAVAWYCLALSRGDDGI